MLKFNETLFNTSIWLPYTNLLVLGLLITWIGLFGIGFNFKNFLITMLCVELTYLGVSLVLIVSSVYLMEEIGQLYALTLIILAAAEAAVGLGLLIVIYRYERTISFERFTALAE